MIITVDPKRVCGVLLTNGGWQGIRARSFEVATDSDGQVTGFSFLPARGEEQGYEPEGRISCPLSSLVALRERDPEVMIDEEDSDSGRRPRGARADRFL